MAEVIGDSSPTTPPPPPPPADPQEQPAEEAIAERSLLAKAAIRSCCRICLTSGSVGPMVSIHRPVPEYAEKTLLHMLLTLCLPLNQRGPLSGLPEQICRNCHWKLLSAYDLYETSLASDAQLRGGGPQGADDLFKHDVMRPRMATVANVKQEARSNDGTDEDQLYHHQQSVMVQLHEPMGDANDTVGLLSGSLGDLLEETKESVPDPMESFMEEHYEFDESTGSHFCGLCKATFSYKSQCRMHIATKHNPAKPFKCDVCFCTLTSLHRLQRHKTLAHDVGQVKQEDAIEEHDNDTGEKTFACPICGKKFSTAVRFKRHKSVHAVHNRPFKCETCLYRFASKSQLTQHAKVHREQALDGDGTMFGCDQCEEQFPGKRALTVHQRRVHGKDGSRGDEEGRERTDYACIICKSSFARESVLNTHMKMHELLAAEKEKEKRLDLERMVKQELQHQMALNNVGPPLPPLSPELLEPSSSVLEPFALGLVPVVKDVPAGDAEPQQPSAATAAATAAPSSSTNNVYNNNVNNSFRKTAMRLSISSSSTPLEKKKPPTTTDIVYVCSMCEREFEEREQLKKHQKRQHRKLKVDIVSTETPSNGGDHPPAAQRRKLLNGDYMKQDDEEDDSFTGFPHELEEMDDDSLSERKGSDGNSPFVCDLCNKSFTHNCYLTMHKRKHHDPAKQYGCKVCHYRFGYRGTLMRHQLIHSSQSVLPGAHGSIIFKCRICSAKFLELMHLNNHLKSHRQPEEPPVPETDGQVQLIRCSECTQVFIDRAQFEEHKMKDHSHSSQSGQPFSSNSRSAETPQSQRLLLHDKGSFRPAAAATAATSGQTTRPYDEPRMLTFPSTSSPFGNRGNDSKLHYKPIDEDDDDEFLNGLSIIKMEPGAE